jgi:hypothetical protein
VEGPLTVHDRINVSQTIHYRPQSIVEPLTVLRDAAFEHIDGAFDKRTRLLHHSDVHKHKASLRRQRVKPMFESTDQAEVIVLQASIRILEAIVEQSVGACILHERLEPSADEG